MQLNMTGEKSILFQIHNHTPQVNPQCPWAVVPYVLSPVLPMAHLLVSQATSTSSFTLTVSLWTLHLVLLRKSRQSEETFTDSSLVTSSTTCRHHAPKYPLPPCLLPQMNAHHQSKTRPSTSSSCPTLPHLLRGRTPEICPSFWIIKFSLFTISLPILQILLLYNDHLLVYFLSY